MLRALLLASLLALVIVPSAHASVADRLVPVYDAADGVTADERFIGFGSKAAKLFRGLAGRQYTSGCAATGPGEEGTSGMDAGRIPRKRGRVEISGLPGADVCFISARLRGSDRSCVLTTTLGLAPSEAPWCARVIVALSADGRAYLDGFSRAAELTAVFFHRERSLADLQRSYGTDVVALPAPDAAPPVGKVGYFDDGHTRAVAALLEDGTRRFVRRDGDVFSTNVEQLTRDPDVLTLF